MRAEAQASIDQIRSALDLLRRFLDWDRALKRLGYGFYEVFTFTCPTYRGTFKPPYERCGEDNRIEMNPTDGLSEFPPELGAESYFYHTRTQRW